MTACRLCAREEQGLTVEASFAGLREMGLNDATFDQTTREGEVTVRFVGELTSVVRNKAGEVIEGSPTEVKRQRDVWTFARRMGAADPNWQLVATGERWVPLAPSARGNTCRRCGDERAGTDLVLSRSRRLGLRNVERSSPYL